MSHGRVACKKLSELNVLDIKNAWFKSTFKQTTTQTNVALAFWYWYKKRLVYNMELNEIVDIYLQTYIYN